MQLYAYLCRENHTFGGNRLTKHKGLTTSFFLFSFCFIFFIGCLKDCSALKAFGRIGPVVILKYI